MLFIGYLSRLFDVAGDLGHFQVNCNTLQGTPVTASSEGLILLILSVLYQQPARQHYSVINTYPSLRMLIEKSAGEIWISGRKEVSRIKTYIRTGMHDSGLTKNEQRTVRTQDAYLG